MTLPVLSTIDLATTDPPIDDSRIGQPVPDETLLGYMKAAVNVTRNVEGDVVECGVWKGFSFSALAKSLYLIDSGKMLYGYDSWKPIDTSAVEDFSALRLKANGSKPRAELSSIDARASQKDVYRNLLAGRIPKEYIKSHTVLVTGWIEETLRLTAPTAVSLIHLDVDLYASYKIAIEVLWPRLSINGMVLMDEYADLTWPGARLAIDEYLHDVPPTNYSFGIIADGAASGRFYRIALKKMA